MQFFSEFMSVLKCLREERNHHYVMAITRKETELENLREDLQPYSKHLTSYAFKYNTMEYYQTTDRLRPLSIPHDQTNMEHCIDYVTSTQEKKSKTLSQSQKFKKSLQKAQVLASLVSEGGMKTFRERYEVLESLINSWQHGHEVVVC